MNSVRVDTDLMAYLPVWYKEIEEYQQIIAAEKAQAVTLLSNMTAVKGNFFFATMNEGAVAEWERVLGIIPNPATETLEFRRMRLINRLSTKPPFSIRFLRQKLDELIGAGNYVLTVDGSAYTIYIEASASNQGYAIEVARTINAIKPAHIVYVLTPFLQDSILMNEAVYGSAVIYNYRLGSWGLGLSPFTSQGEEREYKMAATPSVQEDLLNETAEGIIANIAKARINGSSIISDLTKSRSGSVVTVSYPVTTAVTSLVTKIEFLDADDNVLTLSNVYVPIAQTTTMKHLISVQEGVNGN